MTKQKRAELTNQRSYNSQAALSGAGKGCELANDPPGRVGGASVLQKHSADPRWPRSLLLASKMLLTLRPQIPPSGPQQRETLEDSSPSPKIIVIPPSEDTTTLAITTPPACADHTSEEGGDMEWRPGWVIVVTQKRAKTIIQQAYNSQAQSSGGKEGLGAKIPQGMGSRDDCCWVAQATRAY